MFENIKKTAFISKTLKELSQYLSFQALKVVDMKELALSIKEVTVNFLSSSKTSELLLELQGKFTEKKGWIRAVPEGSTFGVLNLSLSHKKLLGEFLVELYFKQLTCTQGVFLDLRLQNFYKLDHQFVFVPSRLSGRFSSDFRNGVLQLYEGFYENKPHVFDQSLVSLGLLSDKDSPQTKNELKNLFLNYLQNAQSEKIVFTLEKSRESFDQIFAFMIQQNKKVNKDFILFGVVLGTLHFSLSSLGVPLDLSKAFKGVQK